MSRDYQKIYYIALSLLSSPGKLGIWKNLRRYPADRHYLYLSGKYRLTVQEYITPVYGEKPLAAAEKIVDASEKKGIRIITLADPEYPPLLKEISLPPPVIYRKGVFDDMPLVAVVGTRRSDPISEKTAMRISAELCGAGYGIISGMAVGIDRCSHLGALKSGGHTVGVLANGLDVCYPAGNRDIFRMIDEQERSSLISEYPPSVRPGRWTFVRRNRIISGMAVGTVVVKAGERSGALITAGYAADQGKEVFVCTGNSFDSGYSGCSRLIKNGAVLVHETSDIISELPDSVNKRVEIVDLDFTRRHPGNDMTGPLTDLEEKIIGLLREGITDIDAIVRKLGSPSSEVIEAVMTLELSGRISREGNSLAPAQNYP